VGTLTVPSGAVAYIDANALIYAVEGITPDAIHAATALEARCSMYLTNDDGFRRVPGISPTILSDLAVP
jgi:predicted nucleic acid-binding protein